MFENIFFLLSVCLTLFGAVSVVFNKNLMHACISLLGCLFGVAGLYMAIGAEFMAAIQVLVYAGGVIILMLFAIMLTGGVEEIKNKFGIEKTSSMGNKRTYIIATVSTMIFSTIILKLMSKFINSSTVKPLEAKSSVVEIGRALVTNHVLAFEISSVLLLGALIGAAIIARPNKDRIIK